MSQLIWRLNYILSIILQRFIFPGLGNYSEYTIPNIIMKYPILLLFFSIYFVFYIIHLFNRLRRSL